MFTVRCWYTYATNVLGYSNPKYKLVLGITRPSTCIKLIEAKRFLLCPKDTTRHNIENIKESYHSLYHNKGKIVLPEDKFLINLCGEIAFSFNLEPKEKKEIQLLKALGPFTPWTLQHIIEYTSGKKVYQEGMKFGKISIFIVKVFKLAESLIIFREVKPRVANQYFNIEIDSEEILKNVIPIIPEIEFHEILLCIKSIYSKFIP